MDPTMLAQRVAEGICARHNISALYADDAIFDANVPDWRFQIKGASAIAEKFREPDWWPEGATGVVERTTVTDACIVFELCSTFEQHGGTWLSRNAHILALGDDGKIARHTMYCTGDWSPETIARQAAEAPMVE